MGCSMKIAVVGSGVTGLGVAYALSETSEVRLFEKNDRFGGHSNTVDICFDKKNIAVDTGFIVYNTNNYPNLASLFRELKVPTKWSNMSFGFSSEDGKLEYSCENLNTIFAQRKNILSLSFINGLREILRFNQEAPIAMDKGQLVNLSLGEYLVKHRHGKWFIDKFILPMGAAIWSTPTSEMLNFPALNFVSFFQNHDLLAGMSRSQSWRTVDGGSKVYVDKIIKKLGSSALTNTPVTRVKRIKDGVNLTFSNGEQEKFDHVVICSHAPQAMKMLTEKTNKELELLGHFKTSKNRMVLHSDKNLMPNKLKTWSSWNFRSPSQLNELDQVASVTYWMNRLQGIDRKFPIFATLNPLSEPDLSKVHAEFEYSHPIFNKVSFQAQRQMDSIQGEGGVWYAGAWLGYGFHEDGLTSGLRVVDALVGRPEWAKNIPPFFPRSSFLKAAE